MVEPSGYKVITCVYTAATHTDDADNFTVRSTCSSDTQNIVQQLVSGNAWLNVENHVGYFNCTVQKIPNRA